MQIFFVGHTKWKLVDPSEKRPMNLWSCKEMRNLHPGSLNRFSPYIFLIEAGILNLQYNFWQSVFEGRY